MKLHQIAQALELRDLTPELTASKEVDVTFGHASDLLSDVLARAPAGSLVVTLQMHLNVVAVAVHASLAGVIFASAGQPDPEVIRRAVQESVPLFASELPTFELAGRLYQLGLRGAKG